MNARPYIIAETNWKSVQETAYEVVVLPWGATEAHNYHLPYATDNMQNEGIAAESARIAWKAGARVGVLPNIPFGVQTGQLDIPLCINMNPSTQMMVLRDVIDSLAGVQIPKLAVFNGHGGNDFKQMLRELQAEFPEVFLTTISWFKAIDATDYFSEPGDHAGALETALIQHLHPDLVRPLSEAGDGSTNPHRIRAIREKWAWAQRDWLRATNDTGDGDPSEATAEKGAAYFKAVTEKIAEFFVDLAAADTDDLYERP